MAVRSAAADRFPAAVALPSAAAGSGALARVASVQVEFDYLRLGMGYLELPLADGSTIEAANAVFEDRGEGNLMWTGEVPGAGYESVLFTLQDEHLVGWFGEPGGPKYVIHAGPDGRGTVTVEQGPTGDWCGVESAPPADLEKGPDARPPASAVDGAAAAASSDTLDILLPYTSGVEMYWRPIGGAAVGIQQLEDYLNMVFRNGAFANRAKLTGVRWKPKALNDPALQAGHRATVDRIELWLRAFRDSDEVHRLRLRHSPDFVYFTAFGHGYVPGYSIAGRAYLRSDLEPWIWGSGFGTPSTGTLAHELGHNLGGLHLPESYGSSLSEVRAGAVRPYAFPHYDLSSCSTREGYGGERCPVTIMDGGGFSPPAGKGLTLEPFYSSVRHKPNGWTIGVAGERENERVFHETIPVSLRNSEAYAAERYEQYPRRVTARWTDRNTVRVSFAVEAEGGGRVALGLAGGGNDEYGWSFDWNRSRQELVLDEEHSSDNLTPLLDANGAMEGVELTGLRPGGRYKVSVVGPGRTVNGSSRRSLRSDVFDLRPPPAAAGGPAAPERLAAQVTGEDGIRLTWQGESPRGGGLEIWYRKWSGEKTDETWRRYGAALPASDRSANVGGLVAEEEVLVTTWRQVGNEHVDRETARRGRYSFVVVAYNDDGFAASDTFDHEFMPGPFPEATPAGETPACELRSSGVVLDGYEVEVCVETPAGERRRAWDYRLEADRSGLLYFFDRDNVEVLVKVLDGCGVNGHRWVFVAPVTTLGFRLSIEERGPWIANRRQEWFYDSMRRPQDEHDDVGGLWGYDDDGVWRKEYVGNPRGRTARTVSDTTAFPCTTAEIASAKAKAAEADGGRAAFLRSRGPAGAGLASVERRSASASATDCEPGGPALTLAGGYKVSMCYETYAAETGDALDWGLDSSQSALLYFFERDNAEVLIKVLDGCGVNGHRWVFVAPVTDLAFNLIVESPDGQRWTHKNRLGQTADAASDVAAFGCT